MISVFLYCFLFVGLYFVPATLKFIDYNVAMTFILLIIIIIIIFFLFATILVNKDVYIKHFLHEMFPDSESLNELKTIPIKKGWHENINGVYQRYISW